MDDLPQPGVDLRGLLFIWRDRFGRSRLLASSNAITNYGEVSSNSSPYQRL